MAEDLVNVRETATLQEAQLIVNRLQDSGIEAFIDGDDSPFDGLTAADQMKVIRVLPENADKAAAVIAEFDAETAKDFDQSASEEDA